MYIIHFSYVAWGYPSLKTVHDLIYKRGYAKVNGQRIPITNNDLVEESLGTRFSTPPRNALCASSRELDTLLVALDQYRFQATGDYSLTRISPCEHFIFFRQGQHHLYGGSGPRDLLRRSQLQEGQQLPVALQAEQPQRWLDQEDQPLRRGWRLRKPRGQDQQAVGQDDLNCFRLVIVME